MMILAVLERPAGFNELKRRPASVTQRVLTRTVRRLERNGMIERRVLPTSPIGVEYSLAPLGESLREPFGHLYCWTVEHSDEIQSFSAPMTTDLLRTQPWRRSTEQSSNELPVHRFISLGMQLVAEDEPPTVAECEPSSGSVLRGSPATRMTGR